MAERAEQRPAPAIGDGSWLPSRVVGALLLSLAASAVAQGQAATLVGLTLVALNAAAGWLFLRRAPPSRTPQARRRAVSWLKLLACAAAVPAGALCMWLAPPPEAWPPLAVALFAAGGAGAVASLARLGPSFAVLPALRPVVSTGPYAVVRHPAYACELVMVVACAWAAKSVAGVAALALAVLAVTLRIRVEEEVLGAEASFESYARRVRWRLVPRVW
jgi:protein-S-isoprenylcysteine O-methyltransferase Ste14